MTISVRPHWVLRLIAPCCVVFVFLSLAVCTNSEDQGSDAQCGGVNNPCPPVDGCTDPTALNYNNLATHDDGTCVNVYSSPFFLDYIKPHTVPGKFPKSPCDSLTLHHQCMANPQCNWLRTIKDNGVCREDPVNRCLASGECVCRASDFHGEKEYDDDLEIFIPMSIASRNVAPGSLERFRTSMDISVISNESLENYTSRTDFTHKTLSLYGQDSAAMQAIIEASGLSLTMKLMHVWDALPQKMSGTLFEGLGMRFVVTDDKLLVEVGGNIFPIDGEDLTSGNVKNYQCNQLAVTASEGTDVVVYLGDKKTTLTGVSLDSLRTQMASQTDLNLAIRIGRLNAKVWDLRLYGKGRVLTEAEIGEIGKRCGSVGDYGIPSGYPQSNRRYSWGMGGYDIVRNHESQHFASGVYTTMWVPQDEGFPPTNVTDRKNLQRMIGFWDRWHEQMFFEMDFLPFVDTRNLSPEGSLNSYRNYTEADGLCADVENCGEPRNYNNPCKYVTDLFQGFNWLPEDFPNEPTSADHRKIAERGGFTRWNSYDSEIYSSWQRPVHEHGHTAHFTLMRTYKKLHHYIRGISGESFAEIMAYYLFAGSKSWMNSGLTYYPSIPLSFEGRWDANTETHVLKSPQPYQGKNIDDLGLGARFYGLNVWWTFVSHYAAKPYLIGRLSADTDQTPGTTLQQMRFYLAQENLDLGDLFGNYAAHVATWDWPYLGHNYYEQEQEPFEGIERWCTENSGPNCTVEKLKIQAQVHADDGTNGQWVDGPSKVQPGGFAYNTIKITDAPGGSLYRIGLEFDVPTHLYRNESFSIAINPQCREDPRFFSSRIVVVDKGDEGKQARLRRPQYYKIPGRKVEDVIIEVPPGQTSTIYLLAIPTPPFELEDVPGFVDGFSLLWPYKYKIEPLAAFPPGTQKTMPIELSGSEMLNLDNHPGNGFTYDCFYDAGFEKRNDALNKCIAYCSESGFQNSSQDESCNQQLSCRNACYIRYDGVTVSECEGHCDRTNSDGCYLMIAGRDYSMCGPCIGEANNGLVAECTLGCNYSSSEP